MRLEDRQPWTEASQDDISHGKHDRTSWFVADPIARSAASQSWKRSSGKAPLSERATVIEGETPLAAVASGSN
jgi:hypothetical protein